MDCKRIPVSRLAADFPAEPFAYSVVYSPQGKGQMDADIKKRWVEALRSGKYAQGKNWLRNKDNFCCLGVLCDLKDAGAWEDGDFHFNGYDADVMPPHEILAEASLTETQAEALARLNDNGRPFPEIADYIEANL